ncbi:hypothetical protein NQ318_005127 [Aromia moschata]|uniref:Uncharacterized protein n=1 Tax=Aromia moschata TaxID=1265417 RepID=A0AAV8XSH8_9CUCU|nr:hypothetical protein NQ318_005127 [Aromia moschata]
MFRVVRRIQDKKVPWKSRKAPELKLYRSVNYHSNTSKPSLLPPVRFYSSQHAKKTGGGEGIVIALGAITLAGGATLGYAKYDPDFEELFTNMRLSQTP